MLTHARPPRLFPTRTQPETHQAHNNSDIEYSSEDDAQFDAHFTHLQLCDEEDLYNNTVRSAEQALLTIHGNSLLDSENEDLGIGDNLLSWSGICNNVDALNKVESDADSLSETDMVSLDCEDEDCCCCDEDNAAQQEDNADFEDERRFHLAALPFRTHLDSDHEREDPSTAAARSSLYAAQDYEEDEEEGLPNQVPYYRAVGRYHMAQARMARDQSIQAGEYLQRESTIRVAESPPDRHIHHGGARSPLVSSMLPLPDSVEDQSAPATPMTAEPASQRQTRAAATGIGFLNPRELACEILRSAREEKAKEMGTDAGRDEALPSGPENDVGTSYGRYAEEDASSPFGKKKHKQKERVKFVWQPYESFSQYNFHTMYSMKKKSRADNPLPAVGSALTGLVHMYQNKSEEGKLPLCYFASKFPPTEYIKRRREQDNGGSGGGRGGEPSGQGALGEAEEVLREKGKQNAARSAAALHVDKQKKSKLTLRRERAKSPLHASMLVAKHSTINHRRPSRIVSSATAATTTGGAASALKAAQDQPSTSSGANNHYLHNSSLLKGVVRGMAFKRVHKQRAEPLERRRRS